MNQMNDPLWGISLLVSLRGHTMKLLLHVLQKLQTGLSCY